MLGISGESDGSRSSPDCAATLVLPEICVFERELGQLSWIEGES